MNNRDIDRIVLNKYGQDGYRELKAKAGYIASQTRNQDYARHTGEGMARITESLNLSNMANKSIYVLCIDDLGSYRRGKRYKITIEWERGGEIKIGHHTFEKFTEVARYFKHIKTKEK